MYTCASSFMSKFYPKNKINQKDNERNILKIHFNYDWNNKYWNSGISKCMTNLWSILDLWSKHLWHHFNILYISYNMFNLWCFLFLGPGSIQHYQGGNHSEYSVLEAGQFPGPKDQSRREPANSINKVCHILYQDKITLPDFFDSSCLPFWSHLVFTKMVKKKILW